MLDWTDFHFTNGGETWTVYSLEDARRLVAQGQLTATTQVTAHYPAAWQQCSLATLGLDLFRETDAVVETPAETPAAAEATALANDANEIVTNGAIEAPATTDLIDDEPQEVDEELESNEPIPDVRYFIEDDTVPIKVDTISITIPVKPKSNYAMMAAVIVFVVIAVLLAYFTSTTLTSTARYVRRNTAACTVAVSPCPVPGTRLNRGDLLSVREHEGNGGWFKIVDGAASGQFLTADELAIDQPPRLVAICGTGFAADCPSRLRRPVALCTSVACTEAVNYRAGTRVAVVGGVAAASLVELEITATGVVRYAAPQDIGIEMGSPPVATPTVMPTVAPAEQVAIDPAAVMPPSVRPQDSRSRNAPTARPRDQLPTSPRGNSRSGTNMEAAGNGAYGSYRPPPVATPQPSLAVGPQPINNESRWVTERDYPRSAQEDGISGRTQLLLTIDAAGSIARCDIVQSSGSAALDAAACNAITRRARFKPALDAYGNPTVGTYLKSVRWAL